MSSTHMENKQIQNDIWRAHQVQKQWLYVFKRNGTLSPYEDRDEIAAGKSDNYGKQ